MDLAALTISEASQLIQQRAISPVELAQACLDRIEKYDPELNCFITLTADDALKQAHKAQTRLARRKITGTEAKALYGIPLALKDLFETKGVLTTAGSTFFATNIPTADAYVVQKLKKSGAVLLGKLNMHEIALGVTNVNPHYGSCHNPWDLHRIPGGSSGGSAAAVAADLCLGALGSDSGGSIRIPASLCGVVGLKPTYGRVSLRGVIPLSWHTDHVGPLAKSVRDAALLLSAITGFDRDDPAAIWPAGIGLLKTLDMGVRGWKIALAAGDYVAVTEPQVWQAIEEAVRVFESLGVQIHRVEMPGLLEAARANGLMVTSDGAAYHKEHLEQHPEGFGADVLQRLQGGQANSSSDYALARRTQTVLRRQFERFFDDYDLLLTPTTPVAAPLIDGPDAVEQARLLTRFTAPFNLTGLPALSVPAGFTSQNLPVGLQLITRPWAEAILLRAGHAYEQAAGWRNHKPALEKT